MTVAAVAVLIARSGLVLLFLPASALDKIFNYRAAVAQSAELFAPRAFAVAATLGGLAIEIAAPIGVVTGIADRLAALVLAGYCVATALLFKRFWEASDFWKTGESRARSLFWDFLKNFSLGAAFLLLTIGPAGGGLAPFLADPLASSHPYARPAP